MNKSNPPAVPKKAQKKATKKVVKQVKSNTVSQKQVALSTNPSKRVAKNVMSSLKKMTKEQVQILLSIMAPKEFLPQRLGSQLGSYQTAVANPYAVYNTGWCDLDPSASTGSISGPVSVNYVFRDPFRFNVYCVPNASTTTTYEYRTTLDGTVFYSTTYQTLQFNRLGYFSGTKLHGDYLYPGKFSNNTRTYVWCDATSCVQIINGSTYALSVLPFYARSDGQISRGTVTGIAAANTGTFTLGPDDHMGTGCYVGFDLAIPGGTFKLNAVQISVNSQGQAGIWWGHRSLPWIDQNVNSIDAIKIYGASLMITNEASPLNRQGKLAAAQITEGRDWRQFTNYQAISSIKDSYVNNALNGYYGFLKPTQPKDIDFRDQTSNLASGSVNLAWFSLDNPSDFLACATVVTDVNGRDMYATISSAVEYRTEDQFRDVEPPTAPWSVVFEAMTMISQAPQHHENPFHISDIFDWLGEQFSGLWRGVKEAYPIVMEGLNTAVKVGGIVAPLMAL